MSSMLHIITLGSYSHHNLCSHIQLYVSECSLLFFIYILHDMFGTNYFGVGGGGGEEERDFVI